ncbi:MAG: glycosyltransferase family 1 protein [Candidatus Woesebacteria bacterium]|nr:glycosyltransferase family 1 protein [Candidatus Woesebacteria bacterium]
MNIGIDGNEANVEDRVGVNKYAFEMLWGIKKENEKKPNPHNLIVYLKNKPFFDLPKESNYFKYKVINGRGVWIITKLTPHLLKNPEKIDVLFSPSHYTAPFLTIPRVCSIMDLGYLENTTQFEKKVLWQLKYWTAISIFASKQVLTISEASKNDIVRHYPFASKKITVTHLGYDRDKFRLGTSKNLVRQVKNKYSIVDDYILFLGTLKPSKNIEGLLDALLSLKSKKVFKNLPQLVVAGKKGWMFDDIYKKVKDLDLTDKVIFTDFIKEEEKPTLIAGSKLFVLPSFWEGFGLDILSAFGCGVPVVVSNVGSLPEVAGNAGVYVDPNNTESVANAIEKVLKMNKEEYNSLRNLGFEQAKKFSWENCSKKTLEVIENAIRQKR